MLWWLARALFHLLPLVPLALGYVYLTLAAVLLVGLAYIKTRKLEAQAAALQMRAGRRPDERQARELRSLEAAARRWRRLTFLPPEAGSGSGPA